MDGGADVGHDFRIWTILGRIRVVLRWRSPRGIAESETGSRQMGFRWSRDRLGFHIDSLGRDWICYPEVAELVSEIA
jgi:hypothetical protein